MGEQAEQVLDPWAGAAQVLGGPLVVERSTGGEQEILTAFDHELRCEPVGQQRGLSGQSPQTALRKMTDRLPLRCGRAVI